MIIPIKCTYSWLNYNNIFIIVKCYGNNQKWWVVNKKSTKILCLLLLIKIVKIWSSGPTRYHDYCEVEYIVGDTAISRKYKKNEIYTSIDSEKNIL